MTPSPSFDRLAPAYQLLERIAYGPLLHRCRTVHLSHLLDSRRALILGDGDGRFAADLLRANQQVVVESVDISAGMLALARTRVGKQPGALDRIRFLQADVRSRAWRPGRYDLIVTNFFLDCFPAREQEALVDRIAAAAVPGALWLDGDFREPAAGWPRRLAKAMLFVMYLFFAIATRLSTRRLADPGPFLASRGFDLLTEATWLRGFLSSRLWRRPSVSPNGRNAGCSQRT